MTVRILEGDALTMLRSLETESVQLVCTSPPYFQLRNYGVDGQIGLEDTPAAFIARLVEVFDEVRRVLRPDGLVFVNLSWSYAGSGRGPTGHNGIGNQAKRQGFVGGAGDSGPSRSLALEHAPACDSDDRERSGSPATDFAYFGLCDGCLIDFLIHRDRSSGTSQQPQHDGPLPSRTGRDIEPRDSSPVPPDVWLRDARESTTLESWRRSRGECSRCASRQVSFARLGLPTDGHDARVSAHRMDDLSAARSPSGATQDRPVSTAYKGETVDASDCRTVGMDADSSSYPYSTIGERHWKAKDLILIPEMFALEMQAKGWYVRQQIVWSKKAPMPESVRDRFTSAWEPIWMFSKSPRYFFDQEAVRVPALQPLGQARLTGSQAKTTAGGFTTNGTGTSTLGTNQGPPTANMRNVWHLSPEPSREAHYASYPTELVRRCILAGTSERGCCPSCGAPWTRVVERKAIDRTLNGGRNGFRVDEIKMQAGKGRSSAGFVASDTLGWQQACSCPTADPVPCVVLDCFGGSGTTGLVADRLGRDAILVELNPEYCEMARRRIEQDAPMVSEPVEVVSAADAPHDALSLFDALEAALIERGGAVGRAR